ncbi:MAG: transketolase, partial [Chloroflexi bacterium]|nr:transketolase [Chloroflexota bacterium]
MRKQCLDQVFELAKQDERVVFIGSDLGAGTLAGFKAELPSRFFMEGISEALVVGMAA